MKRWSYIITSIIALILSSTPAFAEDASIPNDAVTFNNHYYKLYDLNMSWEDAQTFCENIGGHLATITSQDENDFLFRYITSQNCNSAYFGASDKDIEGVWEWVTDEEFLYSNWHDGEPNNDLNSEHYVMFYYEFEDGTWNDGGVYCNAGIAKTPYICEWDINNILTQDESDTVEEPKETAPSLQDKLQSTNENTNISSIIPNNDTDNNKRITIEINIDNLSLLGGISLLGSVSFIGLVLRRKNKD